jgi:hypothetical protein
MNTPKSFLLRMALAAERATHRMRDEFLAIASQ